MKSLEGWLPVLLVLFTMTCSADTEVDLARAEAYALDGVITSYSIHYTKLYEICEDPAY